MSRYSCIVGATALVISLGISATALAQAPYAPPSTFAAEPNQAAGADGAPAAQDTPAPPPTEPPQPTPTRYMGMQAPSGAPAQQWSYGENGQIVWGDGEVRREEDAVKTKPTVAATPTLGRTTLRAEQPVGTFLQGNYTYLTEIKVRVRNQGSSEARNISILAYAPGSRSKIYLTGPGSLPPGGAAEYSAQCREIVRTTGNIQIDPNCQNCR